MRTLMSTVAIGLLTGSTAYAGAICGTYPYTCTYVELEAYASATGSGPNGALPPVTQDNTTPGGSTESLGGQTASTAATATNTWTFDDPNCCTGTFRNTRAVTLRPTWTTVRSAYRRVRPVIW
jgi:hypothetical protein